MQYPVPQFTEVEDRIIAGLSFKQFGIVLVAAVITFFTYSISKNVIATISVGIILGLPSLALAFGKLNGRPLYASTGNFIRFLFGAKIYTFQKQVFQSLSESLPPKIHEEKKNFNIQDRTVKIKELNYLLQQHASDEKELLGKINKQK